MTIDLVNHPPHYNADRFGIECIALTRLCSFNAGNAVKYIWRHAEKNGVEDLRKARVYLGWFIEDRRPAFLDDAAAVEGMKILENHVRPAIYRNVANSVYWPIVDMLQHRTQFADDLLAQSIKHLEAS